MIVLLDTSTPVCKLTLVDDTDHFDAEWQADRTLAKGLLGFINKNLQKKHKTWQDISAIGVFEGPGSFTGLRIGLTVLNTLADSQHIPIVGARGISWQKLALERLDRDENDRIIMPFYGSEAHVTTPRK
jgi:tRNA threonylcarbamoyladenosine biosynthesis protein TsaB